MKAFVIGLLLATALCGTGEAQVYGSKSRQWGTTTGNGWDISASAH